MIFNKRRTRSDMLRSSGRLIIDLKHLHKRTYYYRIRLEESMSKIKDRLKEESNVAVRKSLEENLRILTKVYNTVINVEIVLEVLITRLETLGLLNITPREILMLKEVLKEITPAEGLPNDLALIIEDLIDRANDLLDFMPVDNEVRVMASNEARNIIKEAEFIAKQKKEELISSET